MSILGQFQFRRDVASAWTSANPILLDGEMGIESDSDKFKIGDGVTAWNALPYGGIKGDTGATGATGARGFDGWEPVLANETDGQRRVLRLVDWIGGEGQKPAVPANSYVGPTGFTNLAGATDIRGETGATGATGAQGAAGATGATGVQGPQGATGETGPQGPAGSIPAVTRTAPTASASTALTTIQSFPIAAGEIVPGSEYEFSASLRVINTTTTTNSVVTLSVGATNVLVLTQANGGTAAAAPGAPVQITGRITFLSATQAECQIHFAKSQAVAANIILNTSAPIAVSAAGATTIDLKYNTSGTTATFICRQATIKKVK